MRILAIAGLTAQELIVVLLIVLLLFGAKKLPEMARSLGKAKKEFQEGLREMEGDDKADGGAKQTPAGSTDDKPTTG